ncbi:MAG: hypothetical protein ACXWH5_14095 [Actinomycetota bacterium]
MPEDESSGGIATEVDLGPPDPRVQELLQVLLVVDAMPDEFDVLVKKILADESAEFVRRALNYPVTLLALRLEDRVGVQEQDVIAAA